MGHPGSGKTTSIRTVVDRLRGRVPMSGFFTEETLEGGRRVGFQGVTLDGRTFPLAHVRFGGTLRLGPYGVDLSGLESTGIDAITPAAAGTLVVIDEIGKMECLSEAFKSRVARLMADDTPLLATVPRVGVGFVKRVRNDARARLYELTRGQSDGMAGEIVRAAMAAIAEGSGGLP